MIQRKFSLNMNNLFYRNLETLRGRKKREEKDKQLAWGERR